MQVVLQLPDGATLPTASLQSADNDSTTGHPKNGRL